MNDWRRTRKMVKGCNGSVGWIDKTTQEDSDRQSQRDKWQAAFDALPTEHKEAFWRLSSAEQERLYMLTAEEFLDWIAANLK